MKYSLQDLIDIQHFQDLQDRLNKIYSFPSSIIDNDGNILTATAWQEICTKFHRKNKYAERICIQSDQYINDRIHEADPALSYHCPHGLVDNALPIIIDGVHYGNFFTGQFFLEEPNLEFFRDQAKKYGFNEKAYLDAVKKVPVWTQEQLDDYLFFIKGLIDVIAESGLKKLKEIENRKRIQKSEARYRSILKAAMDGYWVTDTKGQLIEVNDAYCRMSGYSENELLKMRVSDIEVIETPDLVITHLKKVISEGSDRFKTKHRHKNGTIFDVEVSVQYRSDEGGLCICFLRDITKRLKSEQSLKKSEARFRSFIENANDIVYTVSPEGEFTYLSPNWLEFIGEPAEAAIGKSFRPYVHPEDVQICNDFLDKVLTSGKKQGSVEYRVKHKDKSWHWHVSNGSPLRDSEGVVTGYLGISRDVTDFKRIEQALKESEAVYRSLADNFPNGALFLFDENFRYLAAAGEALTKEGFSPQQIVNKKVEEVFPDLWETIHKHGKLALSGHRSYYEVEYRGHLYSNEALPIFDGPEQTNRALVVSYNITETRAVELNLKKSEKRYREHFSQFPIPTFVWTKDGKGFFLSDYNLAAEDITEGKVKDIKGIYADQLYADPESHHLLDSLERCFKNHKSIQKEFEYRLVSTGRKQYFKGTWVYITPDKVVLHTEEITERKKAGERIRTERERFKSLLELFPGYIYLQSPDHSISYTNQYFSNEFGKPEGRMCHEIFHGKSRPCSECKTFKVFETKKPIIWERDKAPNGKSYLVFDFPFLDSDGSELVLEFGMDITERKKTEKLLEESETLNRLTLSNIHDTIILTDDNGDFVFICPNVHFITGYSDSEVKEMGNIKKLIGELDYNHELFEIEGNIQNIESEILPKDGYKHNVLIGLRAIDFRNASRLYTIHDITEIKKIQKQLDQAQRMEAIGNLAGGIAHDFNNILFPIIGLSDLMLEDLPPDSLEHENAQEIYRAGQRAKDLVNQILSFSRQTEHEMMWVKFQKVLKEVLKLCRATIPTNIEIEQNIQSDCGSIWADATQLHQIGMNLITNAYHAVQDKNGKIIVDLKEVFIDEDDASSFSFEPGKYALFSVTDNGIGMEDEIKSKVFDPYFTTKEIGKGTGLGLAVVYGIIKDFGGDIKVYSESGVGTTFNVYLPLADKSSDVKFSKEEIKIQTGHEHILLVDDELSIVRLVQLTLERLGYTVTARVNSIEALEVFKKNPDKFDMIISDMSMPDMTGDQLANEIRKIRPMIPIIICTGFSERINKDKAKELGVNGFLMKPIVKSEVAAAVRKIFDEVK